MSREGVGVEANIWGDEGTLYFIFVVMNDGVDGGLKRMFRRGYTKYIYAIAVDIGFRSWMNRWET